MQWLRWWVKNEGMEIMGEGIKNKTIIIAAFMITFGLILSSVIMVVGNRFQITIGNNAVVRYDSLTGKTWTSQPKIEWYQVIESTE